MRICTKIFRLVSLLLATQFQIKSYAQSTCPGFGTNGLATSLESHTTHLNALTVLANGKIIAVGYYDDNTDVDFLVARYNANGTPDLTFSSTGARIYDLSDGKNDVALCVAVASDGNILVGGTSEGYGIMIKLNTAGDVINSFGTSGKLKYSTLYSTIESIVVSTNGNIYAAGKNFNSANIVIRQLQVKAFSSSGADLAAFSDDGRYDDPEFLVWHETSIEAAMQSDGKIVVGGTTIGPNASIDVWSLIRLNTDGSPDTGFGTDGRVDDPETAGAYMRDLVIAGEPIFVGGYSNMADDQPAFPVAKKFKSNGDSDNSFNMTGSAVHLLAGNHSVINAIAVDGEEQLFIAGARGAGEKEFILGAFDGAGEPDGDFGVHADKLDGMPTGEILDMARLEDGTFIVCGYAEAPGHHYGVLRKYNADGTVQSAFNSDGASVIRHTEEGEAYSVVVQPDGKIIVGGVYLQNGSNTGVVFARFLSNGSPDVTFGKYGFARYDISLRREFIHHMVLLPDGKILAGGVTNDANYGDDYLIIKLNPDGSLDEAFGTGGYFKKHVGAYGKANNLNQIAVDSEGRILIAGDANYLGGSYVDATLMRVLPNGTVDTSFGENGVFRKQFTSVNDYFTDVVVAQDGSIYAAGHGTVNIGAAVMKVTDAGVAAPDFGTDGVIFIDWSDEDITRTADIVIQPDGKLLVTCTYRDPDQLFSNKIFLFRASADGTPDATFGEGGMKRAPIFGGNESPEGLQVDAAGKIYVSGMYTPASGNTFFMFTMDANGTSEGEPFESLAYTTESNLALNTTTGNVYVGVSPDGIGGLHVICLGAVGDEPADECAGVPAPDIAPSGNMLIASDGDSYQWYQDGDILEGETEQSLTIDPLASGTFSVEVTTGSCTQMSDDFDYVVTALNPGELTSFHVYPNPFVNEISITSEHDLSASAVTIYSVAGAMMLRTEGLRGNEARVPVHHIGRGAYILCVESPQGKRVFKLFKRN